ncbi:MAG: T9SS type A sorting domain-containing protein [Ignavibacteria bacterium]|nr:T9SS type A sorting domain-containing protein [Ignavibacteria bacterium]
MKKLIYIFFFFSVLTCSAYSQYWVEQTSGVTVQLTSVSPITEMNIWVCGYSGTVLRTTNGGSNWLNVSGGGIPNTVSLVSIWGIDASTAITAGYVGSDTWIWRTSNAGANWVQVLSQPGGFINGIVFKRNQPLHGFAQGDPAGGRWSLFKTSNGGINWDSAGCYLPQAGTEAGWNNSIFIGTQAPYSFNTGLDSSIWFGTNNTRIYYSTNFGSTWISQSTAPEVNTYALAMIFFGGGEGLAGGTNLIRSSNYGANWSSQASLGTGNFSGFVMFPAPVDFYGYCWYTRNTTSIYRGMYGSSWAIEYTAPAGNYRHFTNVRNSGICFGVRSNGGITRCNYYFSGITQTGNSIPENYSLSQNYPNPFNPVTKIKFSIPVKGNVKLSVFDALGRVVNILVNQNLNYGTYEAEWNASDYPSGVYFYKLETEKYSETKKMALVK